MRTLLVLGLSSTLGCGLFIGEDRKCEWTEHLLELDEPTPQGITAQSLLAPAEGTHVAALVWDGGGDWIDVTSNMDGDTSITFEIAHGGGDIIYVDGALGDDTTAEAFCPDRMEIEIEVVARTADGGIDLAGDAKIHRSLESRLPDDPLLSAAIFFDPNDHAGTLELVEFDPPDPDRVKARVWASFTEESDGAITFAGAIGGEAIYGDEAYDDGLSTNVGNWHVASFPD